MSDTDGLSNWIKDPVMAFELHLQSGAYTNTARRIRRRTEISADSARVYKAMFARFVRYLNEHDLTLRSVHAVHIHQFLTLTDQDNVPVLQSAIQYRYARMFERIFDHLGTYPNPLADIMFGPMKETYKLEGRNKNTFALSPAEAELFIKALPFADVTQCREGAKAPWQRKRDRALQCMLLGAGLKVSEVVALRMDEIDSTTDLDGTLRIRLSKPEGDIAGKHATFYDHNTVLQQSFVPDVIDWLTTRQKLGISDPLVFPGRNGKAISKVTVYRQVRQTFERAALPSQRLGGRTLRNTFAIAELDAGTDLVELTGKLGLFEDRSVNIYADVARSKGIF